VAKTALRTKSVIDLTARLVQIPSQEGIDDPAQIIETIARWLREQGVQAQVITDRRGPVAVAAEVRGKDGPRYGLNATLDTAPIGDQRSWSVAPTSGEIRDGWLYGRGSADCKVAVAIFAHIAANFAQRSDSLNGSLVVVFDAYEHDGSFSGMKSFMSGQHALDGVMIGYPGSDEIFIGARGFWRARVTVFGTAAHAGSRHGTADNAIVKAAALIHRIAAAELPKEGSSAFSFGPKVTVTGIKGGLGYSLVPDACSLDLDIRLTPSFDVQSAEQLICGICGQFDHDFGNAIPTEVTVVRTCSAYQLSEQSRMVQALRRSAREVCGQELPLSVAGPSNVGNYLASVGIEATCGFGVVYRNLHAPNEAIEIATIDPIYQAYKKTVERLLG